MSQTDASVYLRKRYYVAIMIFFGYTFSTLLKINVSIIVVDLTTDQTIAVGNTSFIKKAAFDWTPPQKGLILSSLGWGHLTSPVGVFIANRFGGTTTFGFANFLCGLLTLLSPVLIKSNVFIFVVSQFLEGVLSGITVAASYSAFMNWVPPSERARLVNLCLVGIGVGTSFSYPIVGCLTYYFDWERVFYITGGIMVFWYLLWVLTIKDSPAEDKFISKFEKAYFLRIYKEEPPKKIIPPWKAILTSAPVLAYLNERFVESWSFSFLMSCLPIYIRDVYPANIKDIGILSGLPHFISMVCSLIGSWLLDYLRVREIVDKTFLHKVFIMFCHVPAACVLIIIGFWSNFYVTITGLIIFKICYAPADASYSILPLDMGSVHANTLISLAMTCLSFGSVFNPIVMGYMVKDHLPEEWNRYFWFLCIFNLWGALIFTRYGSGEIQPWARSSKNDNEETESVDAK